MDRHLILEVVAYVASALIVVSVMMSSVVRLRLINLLGSFIFGVYGLLIGAYPVAVLNGVTVLINGFFLLRMLRAKHFFQLLPLKSDSAYLPYFLDFYREEIARISPDFIYRPSPDQLAVFILRNCKPVGVFIAEQQPDGVLRDVLDFVIPQYRDLKIGRYLFVEQAEFFRARGAREVVVSPRTKKFGEYLLKVGFEPADQREGALRIRFANA
jgi:hypothetical protein